MIYFFPFEQNRVVLNEMSPPKTGLQQFIQKTRLIERQNEKKMNEFQKDFIH